MATLTIEIPDTMKAFIDREIAAGEFKDANEFIAHLVVLEMYDRDHEPDCYIRDGKIVFANDEQRERLEKKLEEALDEMDRGECKPYRPGEFQELVEEMIRRRETEKGANP